MADAYAICGETKCKRPVYTKEEIDANFGANGKLAVIAKSAVLSSKNTLIEIDYPEGFSSDNCVVLSIMFKNDLGGLNLYDKDITVILRPADDGNNIRISCADSSLIRGTNIERTYSYRLTLYRYK